jgi:hypothetical protein
MIIISFDSQLSQANTTTTKEITNQTEPKNPSFEHVRWSDLPFEKPRRVHLRQQADAQNSFAAQHRRRMVEQLHHTDKGKKYR